jgi:hypothetical protein
MGGTSLSDRAYAADPPKTESVPLGIKTFSSMPRSNSEVAHAHLRAKDQAIEFLPKGEPLELSSFVGHLTLRDKREFGKAARLPHPSTRRFVLSVGIEVEDEDKAKLPKLSASTILDYLANHYVSLQARIQKDEKGRLYLHQRPVVATSKFGKVRITEEFVPGVIGAIKDMHSLGLYLPAKVPPTPDNLRTVVMVHKHAALDDAALTAGAKRVEPHYEFVFIRGRANVGGSRMDLHCFTTSDERTRLHYLKPSNAPLRYSDCTLKAAVYFTRYTGGDLVPADSVVKSEVIASKAVFAMKDLDALVRNSLRLSGDALSNLNETLDAIIDGRIRPAAAAIPSRTPITPTSTSTTGRTSPK